MITVRSHSFIERGVAFVSMDYMKGHPEAFPLETSITKADHIALTVHPDTEEAVSRVLAEVLEQTGEDADTQRVLRIVLARLELRRSG